MTDFEFEPEDVEVEGAIDADADADNYNSPVISGDTIDLSRAPDPLTSVDVPPIRFGETAEFPDGTTITDPYTDSYGNVYQTWQDYVDGVNKYRKE